LNILQIWGDFILTYLPLNCT